MGFFSPAGFFAAGFFAAGFNCDIGLNNSSPFTPASLSLSSNITGSESTGPNSKVGKKARTAGNTGNSREILVIPGNYWEKGYLLIKKVLIYLLTAYNYIVRQE